MDDGENTTEIWRDIPGHKKYQVSDHGRVRTKPRVLKPWITNGYEYIALGGRFKTTVHRLVCRVFHGEPTEVDDVVAHGDGSRTNNRASNLRWATYSENFHDSIKHETVGLAQYTGRDHKGEAHPQAKLTDDQVRAIRAECQGQEPPPVARLARFYGVSGSTVSSVAKGRTWKHLPK